MWQQACALLYGLEQRNGFGAKDLATAVGQSLQRRIYDSRKPKCEDCGLKLPTFRRGPGPEAKKGHLGAGAWCGGCAKGHPGAVPATKKNCEDCQLKIPSFGLPAEGKPRWCSGCAKGHTGAGVNVVSKMCDRLVAS